MGSSRVRYTIWDTSGSLTPHSSRSLAFREADVFLLCYAVSDPASLFSAINHWVPELRHQSAATPIVLVGCGTDLRQDKAVLAALAKLGKSPVSSQQALAMSQQIDAVYVETSVKTSGRGAATVMEVAALTSLGQIPAPALPPSPMISKKVSVRHRSASVCRTRPDLLTIDPAPAFWDQFSVSPAKSGQGSLRSKSSTLSSTKSDSSLQSVESSGPALLSVNTCKTPKNKRRGRDKAGQEKGERMISISCQRLRPDKTYEEVEIEVPAAVYETMQNNSDSAGSVSSRTGERRTNTGLGSRIKCLFSKTEQ